MGPFPRAVLGALLLGASGANTDYPVSRATPAQCCAVRCGELPAPGVSSRLHDGGDARLSDQQGDAVWTGGRAAAQAHCRAGCDARERVVMVGAAAAVQAACGAHCATYAAAWEQREQCEVACVGVVPEPAGSSAPAATSVASCVSECALDLPRRQAAAEALCKAGCGAYDACSSCAAGSYATGGGCAACPPGFYCPPPRDAKALCPAGRYGGAPGQWQTEQCEGACAAGFYCPAGATLAEEERCPAGRYGARAELGDAGCDGECEQGFFCPEASISSVQFACPAGRYGAARAAASEQDCPLCEPGHFCLEAATAPEPCPSGRYGATAGLADSECEGPCAHGFFCPAGSVSATERPCPSEAYPSNDGSVDGATGEEAYQCTVAADDVYAVGLAA